MEYMLIKCVHILSSTILFGTGIGSAFYMFVANRTKNIASIYFATRYVVIADWLFTTPSAIVQIVTGLWMVKIAGYSIHDPWIFWSIILYCFTMLCWIPVVWIQIKMHNIAKHALDNNIELSSTYWKLDICWIILGSLALPAMIAIFYLMVTKPS